MDGFEGMGQYDVLPAHWDGIDTLLYEQFHSMVVADYSPLF